MLFGGETADSYYEEGLTAAMKGDLGLAASRFTRALELNAQMHNARFQLGKCLLRMGKPTDALEHFREAAKHLLQPQPLVDAGYALLLLGRVEEARQQFSDALQIKSEEPRAIIGLARCAAAKEQWGTAVNLTQHAIDQGYDHYDAYFLNARSADKCDMPGVAAAGYSKAIERMDQTIDANAGQATGYYLRGLAYYYQENYSAALDDFQSALARADNDVHYSAYNEHFTVLDMLCMAGLCLKKLGRYDSAKEMGAKILALAPDNETGKRLVKTASGDEGTANV